MTIAFYFDEDAMHNSLVMTLRSRHFDAISANDAGMNSLSDEAQLEFASRQNRVLFSFNVADFCRLHHDWLSQGKSHAGLVLAHQSHRDSIGTLLRGLFRLSAQLTASDMIDRREFLANWI